MLYNRISCFSWGRRAAHNRAQIVYYIAENLELRLTEVARRIQEMTGCEESVAREEVELTIQRLFHWGAYADKYGGTVQVSELIQLTSGGAENSKSINEICCI